MGCCIGSVLTTDEVTEIRSLSSSVQDEEDMEEQEDLGDEGIGAMEGESPVTSAEEMEGTGREVVEIIGELDFTS